MDSEDDMHDANNVDSYEEDYYSGDAMYSDDDDDANAGYDFDNDSDDSDDVIVRRLQKNYTILKEDDTCQRQEDDITRICSVLSVTRDSACMLLRRYNWNVSNVHEAWFADEDKVRKAVGLLDKINIMKPPKAGQSGSLAPGCEFAIKFDLGSGSYDVTCQCSHSFCWNCTEEAHRPVDCETVSKWILKNSAEYENMNWILANSKPCLKCKRPIEKNQGCMHMTCNPPCKYEFCWLCLGQWSDHGERTGGFYACNRYESAKQEGAYDEMAKNSLERYTHYYERWATNQSNDSRGKKRLQICSRCKQFILQNLVRRCPNQRHS